MAHKQSCGGDGGSVGFSSSANALFPHQQTACNTIGPSFSDGAINMPRWNWQLRPHQQQQEKLEQEQRSHLNFPQMQAEVTRSQELFFQQMAPNFPDLNISSIKSQSPYAYSHSSLLSAQLQGRSRKQDHDLVFDSGYLKPLGRTCFIDYNDLNGTDGQKEIMSEKRMERKASEAGEVPYTTQLVTGKMMQKHIREEGIKAGIFPKVHHTSESLVRLSFDCPCQLSYCKKRQISQLESLCPFQWPIHSKKPRTGIGRRRHSFQ